MSDSSSTTILHRRKNSIDTGLSDVVIDDGSKHDQVPEDSSPVKHFGLDKIFSCFWFMFVTTIGIILVVGKISAKQSEKKDGIQGYMFEWFMVTAMGVGLVLMLVVTGVARRGCLCTYNHHKESRLPVHLRQVAFIFGLVTAFAAASGLIAFFTDLRNDNPSGKCYIQCEEINRVSHPMFEIIYFLYVFFQLFFIYRFSIKKFYANWVIYMMLTHIMATNVILWTKVFVDEAAKDEEGIEKCLKECCHGDPSKICNGSNATSWTQGFADDVKPYVNPFILEYALICTGLLQHMWSIIEPKQKDEEQPKKATSKSEIPIRSLKGLGSILVGGAIFILIILIIVFLATDALPSNNDLNKATNFLIYYVSRTLCYVFMACISFIGILFLFKNRKMFHVSDKTAEQTTQAHHIILDVYLLMFSIIGVFLLSGFCFAAAPEALGGCSNSSYSLGSTECALEIMYITDSIVTVVQCVKQAVFILMCLPCSLPRYADERSMVQELSKMSVWFSCCSKVNKPTPGSGIEINDQAQHDDTGTHAKEIIRKVKNIRNIIWFIRHSAGVLAMCNIGFWAMLEYEINRKVSASDFIPDQYYDDSHWLVISFILYPLVIFFRIHSAACLVSIWSKFCKEPAILKELTDRNRGTPCIIKALSCLCVCSKCNSVDGETVPKTPTKGEPQTKTTSRLMNTMQSCCSCVIGTNDTSGENKSTPNKKNTSNDKGTNEDDGENMVPKKPYGQLPPTFEQPRQIKIGARDMSGQSMAHEDTRSEDSYHSFS